MKIGMAVALAALAAVPAAAQDGPALQDTELTLLSVQGEDGASIREVRPGGVIPYSVGDSCYAWHLTFAPVAGKVGLEETLTIPAAASEWGTTDDTVVADDRKSARTTVTVNGLDGEAANVWCVAEGDPEGPYRFVVSYQGQVLGELNFRVLGLDHP